MLAVNKVWKQKYIRMLSRCIWIGQRETEKFLYLFEKLAYVFPRKIVFYNEINSLY